MDHPTITWDAFAQQCSLQFGPPIRRNKLGELVKLSQTGSVEDYQRKFEQLAARAEVLEDNNKVDQIEEHLEDLDIAENPLSNYSACGQAIFRGGK
ncbi:Retrotransposon gag protein [Corchorus capsularis]|uniref:Retrotransposon gag protein n=1 Tax=Corchorus capsularis TaxID=210143 RepID=A0A1R3HR93_COCAP|nr:Retrotransposon gag protein [Corchorus capsularis]